MSNIGSRLKAIQFVDDQAVVSGLVKALQETVNKINFTAKKYNLKIYVSKTKTMIRSEILVHIIVI